MQTEILQTNTAALFERAVSRATELLRAGEVVALPTETVYGLAANAWNADAVRRIFAVKGRPQDNPIIVHVAGLELAGRCVTHWPAEAARLAAAFWPGPLTLVLPRAEEIPGIVTAGGGTVGLRWPSHPFIQAVIRAGDFPLAAPSANLANQISPTNAAHVLHDLGGCIPLIVDGGQANVGIESTVLDLTVSPPRILRPGMISESALFAVLGRPAPLAATTPNRTGEPKRSPGSMPVHYAPKAALVLLQWRDEIDLTQQLARFPTAPVKIHVIAYHAIPLSDALGRVSVIPHDPEAYARALYAELHQCDAAGAELIVVERPPGDEPWRGIADRLARAAGRAEKSA
jgi:L-threonylcarbamoyladenylate synthase